MYLPLFRHKVENRCWDHTDIYHIYPPDPETVGNCTEENRAAVSVVSPDDGLCYTFALECMCYCDPEFPNTFGCEIFIDNSSYIIFSENLFR